MQVKRIPLRPAVTIREEGKKYLVVSDVHLGYEEELKQAGVHVPPQLDRIAGRLKELVELEQPDVLVLLGDVKHRIAGVSWRDAKQLRELLLRLKGAVESIVITPGNHDAGVYALVGDLATISDSRGFPLGDAWLLHGHTWPPPAALRKRLLVMGHTHPTVTLKEEGAMIRAKVFLRAEIERRILAEKMSERPGYKESIESMRLRGRLSLLILPHFNEVISGIDVLSVKEGRGLSPLLRRGTYKLDEFEVITLDGVQLGSVSVLRSSAVG